MKRRIGSVGLFCAATDALPPNAQAAAAAFGAACAASNLRLVYGGSGRGLMGIAARAAMREGGEVVGVMPRMLAGRERATTEITRLVMVDSLAGRKERMAELSDAFVALPGGIGTINEILEMVTWFDIGIHRKPTILCNIDGFWDPWEQMVQAIEGYGVFRPGFRMSYRLADSVQAAITGVIDHLKQTTNGELTSPEH
jgi:uncharacterized protein (TIGR00730 family)